MIYKNPVEPPELPQMSVCNNTSLSYAANELIGNFGGSATAGFGLQSHWDKIAEESRISKNACIKQEELEKYQRINSVLPTQSYSNVVAKPVLEEKPMAAVKFRLVRVFIVDADDNVPLNKRILKMSEEQLTDATDQELFMSLNLTPVLEEHNANRVKMLDKAASKAAGKDIFLEPIRIRDLKMVVTSIAEF